MNLGKAVGTFMVIAGIFIAIYETVGRLGGPYFKASLIANLDGPHMPYWLNMVGCALLVIMGVVLVCKPPKEDPRR